MDKNSVVEHIVMSDPVFTPENLHYIEELYRSWREAPDSVGEEWRDLFSGAHSADTIELSSSQKSLKTQNRTYKQGRVESLIWAYRDAGYLYARLNPLTGYLSADLHYLYKQREGVYKRLTLDEFGLSEGDLHTFFSAGRFLKPERASLGEIIQALTETHCSSVGVEFLHIQNKTIRHWLMKQYRGAQKHLWIQEEPRNRGAWGFMEDRFDRDLDFRNLQYIGREESASPATGFHTRHQQEQEDILNRVFEGVVVKKKIHKDVHNKPGAFYRRHYQDQETFK